MDVPLLITGVGASSWAYFAAGFGCYFQEFGFLGRRCITLDLEPCFKFLGKDFGPMRWVAE